jgi:hypothetical protein
LLELVQGRYCGFLISLVLLGDYVPTVGDDTRSRLHTVGDPTDGDLGQRNVLVEGGKDAAAHLAVQAAHAVGGAGSP